VLCEHEEQQVQAQNGPVVTGGILAIPKHTVHESVGWKRVARRS
jgi:hypothetical protein